MPSSIIPWIRNKRLTIIIEANYIACLRIISGIRLWWGSSECIGLRNFHFPIDLIHVRHGGLDDGEHEYTECHRDDHDDDGGDNDVITGDHWSLLVMTRSVRRRQGQDNTAPTRHVTNV